MRRRFARVTIAATVTAAALAAPAAAPAAGLLDELADRLGCTSGHDGLRCTVPAGSVQQIVKSARICRPDFGDPSCFRRGYRRPPLPGRTTR